MREKIEQPAPLRRKITFSPQRITMLKSLHYSAPLDNNDPKRANSFVKERFFFLNSPAHNPQAIIISV